MKESILAKESVEFSRSIIKYSKYLEKEKKDYVISKQILRSGTSIGANIHEANYAISKAEFIQKLQIALKEANETEYWFIVQEGTYLENPYINELKSKVVEIKSMLVKSINTVKKNMNLGSV